MLFESRNIQVAKAEDEWRKEQVVIRSKMLRMTVGELRQELVANAAVSEEVKASKSMTKDKMADVLVPIVLAAAQQKEQMALKDCSRDLSSAEALRYFLGKR